MQTQFSASSDGSSQGDDNMQPSRTAALNCSLPVALCILGTLGTLGAIGGILLIALVQGTVANVVGALIIFTSCCAFGGASIRRVRISRNVRSSNERFFSDSSFGIDLPDRNSGSRDSGKSGLACELELQEGDLILEQALKRGNYGEVWKGQLTKTDAVVAVKVLPSNTKSVLGKNDLLAEIEIMRRLKDRGAHENVLEMLGFATRPEPRLVLEFIPSGSLEDHLRKMKKENVPIDEVECEDFSVQIARGMKFVADCSIVHRDLASRNVLITPDKVLKVADFGLSRVVQTGTSFFGFRKQGGYCIRKTSNPTAFRWTPPEGFKEIALNDPNGQVPHTEKGDVWCYAVVMMEIATRGDNPYDADIPACNKEKVIMFLLDGKRMQQGPMSDFLYGVARKCWEHDPKDRPSFTQIISDFEARSPRHSRNKNNTL